MSDESDRTTVVDASDENTEAVIAEFGGDPQRGQIPTLRFHAAMCAVGSVRSNPVARQANRYEDARRDPTPISDSNISRSQVGSSFFEVHHGVGGLGHTRSPLLRTSKFALC